MTPDPPVPTTERITGLVAYFRENRDRFTSEALKRAAVDAGYESAEIEFAWSRIAWGDPDRAVDRPTRGGVSALVAVIYAAGTWLGAIGLASNGSTAELAAPGFLAALVGGLLAWVALRDQAPSVARGIAIGLALVVVLPIVFVLVLIGICLATGFNPPF
jgi:hypothetical protein